MLVSLQLEVRALTRKKSGEQALDLTTTCGVKQRCTECLVPSLYLNCSAAEPTEPSLALSESKCSW